MKETCAKCGGTGEIRCDHCGGSGKMPDISLIGEDCLKCHGTGKNRCPECQGSGALPTEIPDPWEKEEAVVK